MPKNINQIYDKIIKKVLTLSGTAVINLINGLFDTDTAMLTGTGQKIMTSLIFEHDTIMQKLTPDRLHRKTIHTGYAARPDHAFLIYMISFITNLSDILSPILLCRFFIL